MSTPNPAATDWVPVWALANPAFSGDLVYKGAFTAGSYKDGDIVIYNGVTYVCVRPTSAAPVAWTAPVYDLSAFQNKSEKGVANGYASLDANTRIPNLQLRASLSALTVNGTMTTDLNAVTESGWTFAADTATNNPAGTYAH